MITYWNNGIESRGRRPALLLVTEDGNVHRFHEKPIEGVCGIVHTAFEKKGRWSNTTYQIAHRPTTVLVKLREDWDDGRFWPQRDWAEALSFVAKAAPHVTATGFRDMMRSKFPDDSRRFDEREQVLAEFDSPLPLADVDANTVKVIAEALEKLEKEVENGN